MNEDMNEVLAVSFGASIAGSLTLIMIAFAAVEIWIERLKSAPSPLRPEDGCTGRRAV